MPRFRAAAKRIQYMTPNETSRQSHEWPFGNDVISDEKKFEDFFRNNFVRYCFYCQYKFGFSTDEAREAVHLAFIKLWEHRETIERQGSISSYLQKVIHNNCLDALKHEKIRSKYRSSLASRRTDDNQINAFSRIDLRRLESNIQKAISELPPQMKKIFEMSRFEELSYRDIADRLDISKKTVETQMGRALAKLRQKLEHCIEPGLLLLLVLKKILFVSV